MCSAYFLSELQRTFLQTRGHAQTREAPNAVILPVLSPTLLYDHATPQKLARVISTFASLASTRPVVADTALPRARASIVQATRIQPDRENESKLDMRQARVVVASETDRLLLGSDVGHAHEPPHNM